MKRRDFLGTNFLALAGGALAAGAADAADSQSDEDASIDSRLSPGVQMQFMRPAQLEAAGRKFPVVYVPFGLIEWHGLHLPLGNDAIKAHGILVKCAEKYGGVVYPPVYFHNGFRQEHLVPVLTELFHRLKRTGYRVFAALGFHCLPSEFSCRRNRREKHSTPKQQGGEEKTRPTVSPNYLRKSGCDGCEKKERAAQTREPSK